jgi:hypothetical protein
MSNHYTYTYFIPYKNNTRNHNPTLYPFDCHYGSRVVTLRAEGPYVAREKAARYFGVGADKIRAVRAW